MSSSKICLLTSVWILILKSFIFFSLLYNSAYITQFSTWPLKWSNNSTTIFLLETPFLTPHIRISGGVDPTTIPGGARDQGLANQSMVPLPITDGLMVGHMMNTSKN